MQVEITPGALSDLSNIKAYIAEHSPAAASRLVVRLVEASDRLEYLPGRGKPGLEPDTRELTTIWPYVIVYRITPASVQILRVLHGAQDR